MSESWSVLRGLVWPSPGVSNSPFHGRVEYFIVVAVLPFAGRRKQEARRLSAWQWGRTAPVFPLCRYPCLRVGWGEEQNISSWRKSQGKGTAGNTSSNFLTREELRFPSESGIGVGLCGEAISFGVPRLLP